MNQILPEELERIERFITGQMQQDEESTFKNELDADATLREKTEEVKLLLLGIQEQSLKEQLNSFATDYSNNASTKKGKVIGLRKSFLLAASVILTLGLAGWWLLFGGANNEKLYSQFYKPDPGLATVMGAAEDYNFEKAMVEYKTGEYDKALTAWNTRLKLEPSNDTLLYFTGMAYQAKGDDDNAIKNLQPVTENVQSAFNKDACWYIGLLWLKKKENKKATGYIERSAHPQKEALLKVISKE